MRGGRQIRDLCGVWFHQDWDLEGHATRDVMRRYLAVTPSSEVDELRRELDALLLDNPTERELSAFLNAAGSYFYPPGGGQTYVEWIEEIRSMLG